MGGPLTGIKVIDFTRILSGPYATMLLGDLGAEIIKIERPIDGDDARKTGPFLNGESGYFMSINRNKKSITLDLKSTESKTIITKLIEKADVVIENFRPGIMEKLGLSYENALKANSRIVYVSCSGFGQTGPYKSKPAYDIIVQGLGGIMSVTGHKKNQPTRVGVSIGDIAAGLYAAISVLTGIIHQRSTGKGIYLDISMLDSQIAILENPIMRYFLEEQVPHQIGNRHPSIAPFTGFKSKQGKYLVIAVGNENMWSTLCKIMGYEELLDDERFGSNALRLKNWDVLEEKLQEKFNTKSREEWLIILEKAGIPCGSVNSIDEVVADPQVIQRNAVIEIDHHVAGKTYFANTPFKISEYSSLPRKPSPTLGQDTKDILEEIGYSSQEIEALESKGII